MPVTVLLIESNDARAQAMVLALGAPLQNWHLVRARTVVQARALLLHEPIDVLLTARRLADGSAYDVLAVVQDTPALILIPEGEEAHAALALRHGFADFVVQDAAQQYLLTLSAQMDKALARSADRHALSAGQARQHRLLQAIARAQELFIASAPPRSTFEVLLQEVLALTDSAFGMVGQVESRLGSTPCLRVHAISDISWDDFSRQRYAQVAEQGMVFDQPHSLIGTALISGEPLISNHPESDPRSGGLPAGHPPLTAFMGLPIHAGGQLVAMVGVANRVGGYCSDDIDFLQPLLSSVGQLEMARRADRARKDVEARLAQASAALEEKTHLLELTLASVAQGICHVDPEGRVCIYNERFLELLNLPDELLQGKPHLDDLARLQRDRGDFQESFFEIDGLAAARAPFDLAAETPRETQRGLCAMYVRRTPAGRYLEVRTHMLPDGGLVRTFTDVSDYMAAQETVRQSEARWRSLTQLSSDWYWEQDAELRFVRLQGRVQGGMPDQKHLGLTRWELPHAHVSEAQWRIHRAQLEAREVFHDFEMQRLDDDDNPLWLSISGEPIFDGEGRFAGYRGLARDITERKRTEAEIERLAFYDELTGLPNRRLLLERLQRAAAACERSAAHGALLFLDLDNFKSVNDTLGHDWGDRLLVQAGERLARCVRTTDTVARLGGDEFVVVLQGLHGKEGDAAVEAETVAQQILVALNQAYDLRGGEMHSTPSIGIAMFHSTQHSAQELLQRADLAMYQAKAQGRNTMCFFDPAMQSSAAARSALEADVRQGLQRGEFLLHYQPLVDAHGKVLGAEALVRWMHPQRGMVFPSEFIALAENTGLILPLGRQVLQSACEQLAHWSTHPVTSQWSVSVNASVREFRHPDYVQQVLGILRQTGADPGLLKLELTESLLLNDVEDSITKMDQLRNQGVGFSLDDFGTGYSSLSYLKRLPLDQIKIDQSFIRDVLTDPNDAAIACTVIALAHSLGLEVVAEGVETQGQRKFLLRNGCQRFQGYLFGRPGPAQDMVPG